MPMILDDLPHPSKMNSAQRFAVNVKRLRLRKFKTVDKACNKSKLSIPRWYRMEQGRYPGMVGILIDPMAKLFDVDPTELLQRPRPNELQTILKRE